MRNFLTVLMKKAGSPESNVFFAVIWSLQNILSILDEDTADAIAQINLKTASGWWLDFWGSYFGIPRMEDEFDLIYRNRIMDTALEHQSPNRSILDIVQTYTLKQAEILEGNGGVVLDMEYSDFYYPDNYSAWAFQISVNFHITGYEKFAYYGLGYFGWSFISAPGPEQTSALRLEGIRNAIAQVKIAGVKVAINPYDETLPPVEIPEPPESNVKMMMPFMPVRRH